jgi:hypothetical protein
VSGAVDGERSPACAMRSLVAVAASPDPSHHCRGRCGGQCRLQALIVRGNVVAGMLWPASTAENARAVALVIWGVVRSLRSTEVGWGGVAFQLACS